MDAAVVADAAVIADALVIAAAVVIADAAVIADLIRNPVWAYHWIPDRVRDDTY